MAEPRRKRGLTSEERRVWRLYTQSVAPLRPRAAPDPAMPDPATLEPAPAPAPSIAPVRAPRRPPEPPAPRLPELLPGQSVGLDKARADRLRRGELPIEARLDLHGMTQVQAHEALGRFLAVSQAQQRRCVLIITGKGFRPGASGEAQKGVLKSAVPRWLNETPNRSRILGFAPAKDRHGGGGAIYVLIKRLR